MSMFFICPHTTAPNPNGESESSRGFLMRSSLGGQAERLHRKNTSFLKVQYIPRTQWAAKPFPTLTNCPNLLFWNSYASVVVFSSVPRPRPHATAPNPNGESESPPWFEIARDNIT